MTFDQPSIRPRRLALWIALIAPGFLITAGRAVAEPSADASPQVTFDDDIKPIFRQHCLNCHNQGEAKGGLALDSFTAMMEGGASGEVVYDDGDVEGSRLWQLINHDDTPVMPPNQDKIPADQLAVVRKWIELGALENSGSKSKTPKKNALSMVASGGGRPEGPAAMPEAIPQSVPVVTGRPAAVTALASSPWAPFWAVAGQRQIVLYHSESGELLGVLPFPEGVPQSIRFSRDGSYLLAAGGEHAALGIVAIYDVTNGERVATIGDELDTVFEGDVNENMTRVALGGPQRLVRVYDATDGELVFELKKHTDWIYAVGYSPDGVLLASADRSGGVHVWEADTGRLYLDLAGHKGAVNAIAWRDDSNVLATAGDDGTVKLWDMHEGKLVKSVNAHAGGAMAVRFDHEGRFVTGGNDRRARLWDAAGNKLKDFEPLPEAVLEVAISHDGQRVAYGDWSGQVFAARSEDPSDKLPLASNPPPIQARIDELKTTLASVDADLAPLQKQWEMLSAELAAAREPVDELRQAIAGIREEAEAATSKAVAADEEAEAIAGRLPALTAASRDGHDVVIATRFNAGQDPQRLKELADAEQALAERLLDLSEQRRRLADLGPRAASQRERAAQLAAEAAEMEKRLPELQQTVERTEQRLAEAAKAREEVAGRRTALEEKMDALAAELR